MPKSSRRKTTGSARRKAKREREAQRQQEQNPIPVQPTPSPQPPPVVQQEKSDPEVQPLVPMTQAEADNKPIDPAPVTSQEQMQTFATTTQVEVNNELIDPASTVPQEQMTVEIPPITTETSKEISPKVKALGSDVSNFMAPATAEKSMRKDDPDRLLLPPPSYSYEKHMATRNAKLAKARRYFGLPTHPTGRIRDVDIPRREFFNANEEVILKAVDEDNLDELVEEMIRVLKEKDEEEK